MLRSIFRPASSAFRGVFAQPGCFLHQVILPTPGKLNLRSQSQQLQQPRTISIRHEPTMPLERSTDPLVWIDCEMTGLDPETDKIIQICCFITDAQLNLLEPNGFETVVHVPDSALDAMSQWCIDTHGRTGLTAAVRASTVTPATAADSLLAYIRQHVPVPRTALLAGNSVHADKAFLACEPYSKVLEHLHYRILDVSSFKEAARRWGSDRLLEEVPPKRTVHLARDDILESIEEIRFYKEKLFG